MLLGSAADPSSLVGLQHELGSIDGIEQILEVLRASRISIVAKIHSALSEVVDVYRDLFAPVQDFIYQNVSLSNKLDLTFDALLRARNFEYELLQMLDGTRAGTYFRMVSSGTLPLTESVSGTDFSSLESVSEFLGEIDSSLRTDMREGFGGRTWIGDQIKSQYEPQQIYDYVFGMNYLTPSYILRSMGKPISLLSPGQKGTLLLVFYLVVDQSGVPLIIDQPEENLDNETIANLLVPAIKMAKRNRQLIMVTHNANLAVVGDADQYVRASFENETFGYESGPLTDLVLNLDIVNVLEGTKPAFANRGSKYL